MPKFLNDISLEQANDLQFKTAAGANAGKIEQDGNDLVLSNAVGDILLGDGAADVYIGDGTNNVDILFEQSGSIKAEDGTSGVTLTLGSSDTTLALGSYISSTLTVGANDTGHDVIFYGATSGKKMQWDESADTLIVDGTLDVNGDATVLSGAGSGSLTVGRNANENMVIYVDDSNTTITGVQDSDTNGAHSFILNRTFQGSGANNFIIQKGGTAQLTIDTNSAATFAGTINSGAITSTGNIQTSGDIVIGAEIMHSGDTNNKIAFGTDTQSFQTGGTARMNISDSGLQIGSGARVTTIENNDSLGTSDTKLATQGNIKAYVDGLASNYATAAQGTLATNALPKAGGTMSGAIAMGNNNITGINNLTINDPGPNEGINWNGGNTKIFESPDDLTTNTAGNLQFVYGSTRRLTVNNTGIDVNGTATFAGDITVDKITSSTYSSNAFLDFDYDETASINNTTLASIARINYIADTNGNDGATATAHAFMTGTTDIDTATSLLTILNNGNATFAGSINTAGNINFTDTTNHNVNSIVNVVLNADSDSNSGDAYRNIIFKNRGTETGRIDKYGNATFTGNGTFETTLNVDATDDGGSPAMTAIINMKGYDQRGVGIKMKDNVNTSGGGTNAEWFVGTGYAQSGFNIGYASDGSQSSYTAQNKLSISTSGNATFAGDITVSGGDITLSGTGRIQGVDTVSAGTDAANKTYVDTAISNLIDNAPENLNTLNELAEALNDDDDAIVTINTALAARLPLAGGTMSGAIAMGSNNITGGGTITGTTLTGTSLDINGNADISGTTTLNNTVYFSSTGMITWGSFAGGTGFGIRGESGRALSLGSNGNFDHLVIDTSGNATFAGTIGSGAITSTGKITGTELEGTSLDINGAADIAGKLQITQNAATLDLVGTDHSYIQWYPDGISAGRKAYTGFGGSTDNNFSIINEISGANIKINTNGGTIELLDNTVVSGELEATSLDINGNADISGTLTVNGIEMGAVAERIRNVGDTDSYIDFGGADTISFATGGTTALTINSSQAATFAGEVYVPGKILHSGDTNTYFGFDLGADTYRVVAGGTEKLRTAAAGIEVNGELQADSLDIDGNADISGDLNMSNNNSDISFTCGSITSDGTTFAFDGAAGKEVLISSARDVRVVIDDNNDDTDNTFEIHKHSFAGGNELLTLNQSGNLVITGTITGTTITASGNINANGNIVGDDSTNITNIASIGADTYSADADSTTRIGMSATSMDFLVEDEDVFNCSSTTLTVDGKFVAKKRVLAKTSNTDGNFDGDVVYFGGTTSMTTGKIYFFNSSGNWQLADADAASTSIGMLGVALGSASDTNGVLIRGMVTLDHDPGTISNALFLSTTAGTATATAPSGSGDIVRVIGYCLDSTNGQIYFNPDGTFVEVSA